MLKAKVIVIGKLKEEGYRLLEQEYLKRLKPFGKIEIVEIRETPYYEETASEAAREEEAGKIEKLLVTKNNTVILSEEGRQMSSAEFAKFLSSFESTGQEVVFVIGSSSGLSGRIKKQGKLVSLGKITLPHNLARIVLLEQIYRGLTINSGKIYHK